MEQIFFTERSGVSNFRASESRPKLAWCLPSAAENASAKKNFECSRRQSLNFLKNILPNSSCPCPKKAVAAASQVRKFVKRILRSKLTQPMSGSGKNLMLNKIGNGKVAEQTSECRRSQPIKSQNVKAVGQFR